MQADTKTIREVLVGEHRYVVPPYQRPYVWERDRQWVPLWEDVVATIDRLAEARTDADFKGARASAADNSVAPHFMGAIVLEQLPTSAGEIDRRAIVDGQQRLTTIQLLLRGIIDAMPGPEHLATKKMRAQLRRLSQNDEDVIPDADSLYKLWPRRAEREEFAAAMADEPPDGASSRFAAARHFFAEQAADWLEHVDSASDPFSDDRLTGRVTLLAGVVMDLLKLVVIDLDGVDDAQVIFEVLNARNTPLTAADLVKNLLFMRAEAEQPNTVEGLYDQYWKPFDDDSWWSEDVGTGHAQRPRMDRFLGDFLIAQTGRLVNLGHLYGTARTWILDGDKKVEDVLRQLHAYSNAYRRLQLRDRTGLSASEIRAFEHIHVLRVVAADPLLLWLLTRSEDELSRPSRQRTIEAIEAYLIRRMATKWQTRAYGSIFAEILRRATGSENIEDVIVATLAEGPSGYHWPSDDDVLSSFVSTRAYGPGGMNQARLRLLLGNVDRHLHLADNKSEDVSVEYANLPIEHIMPQSWRDHWPIDVEDHDARVAAGMLRDQAVQRIGNLTLLTTSLNSSVANGPWKKKRTAIAKHSVLKLNADLVTRDEWNEAAIDERAAWLADIVCKVWPSRSPRPGGEEGVVEELDADAVELIHLDLLERAKRIDGELFFDGLLVDVLESLGIVSDPATEAKLADDALERLVGNGLVDTVKGGLRVLRRAEFALPGSRVPDQD